MSTALKTYSLEAYFAAFVRFRDIFGEEAIKREPYRTMIRQMAKGLEEGKLVTIRYQLENGR